MGLLPKTAKITGEILFTDRAGNQHNLLNTDKLNDLRGHGNFYDLSRCFKCIKSINAN